MGNGCCSAFSSSENEIAMDLGRLEEMVSDLTHLDQLISVIDERLQAIAAKIDRVQQNTSTQPIGSSSTLDSCKNFGKDLVMKMSKRAERNRCMVCFKSAYNRETRKVVIEVLKGATQIQLLGAGICVVGYLLDQIELLSNNRDQCIQILRLLCALARRVKQLDHLVPVEEKSLDEAVNFIFDGCVLCLSQMKSHRFYRIFQASADAGDLQNLESQIRNTYADLTLGAVIGNTPYFPPPTQGQDPKPVGREVARDRVIKLLTMDPIDDSKKAVVIYGFGGIGKTTLASAVFKNLELKGYRFCRLDMDQDISNDGIKQLQQQVLRELFDQGNIMLNSYVEGQNQLTEFFRKHGGDRIFMFIDNALEANNLAKLLPIDLSCLPNGMRILVTTRKLDQTDMLDQKDVNFERIPYEVDVLTSSASKKLLFKIALGSANASLPPGINGTDVEEIVKMCGGIPLLVELVGPKFKKYLSRASEFKSLKEFLKDFVAAGREIERVVDEVYKSLDELSKEAFLDIVCFFDKYDVRKVSAAVGKGQLDVLLDAALVKLSFDDDEENWWSIVWGTEEERPQFLLTGRKVRVHDIIKERGRWLSKQDRIVEVESLKDALQDTQKLQKIKGIAISNSKDSDVLEIEAERLDIMHSSLRVLKIANSVKVNGICQRSFESLKYLSVDGNLPIHPKQLKRLAVLTGPEGANSENVDKLPASLQILSLKYSANIPTLLQSFDTLSSLEYLKLEGCHALVKVPTSFGQLQPLIGLNLEGCSNLATLPENIENLSALQFLDLSSCTELASLPPTFGQLKSLQFLYMRECSELTCLPDNFHNLSTLQMLTLQKCEKLVELPKSFGALSALKSLEMSSCSNLKFLPESFGQLKSLKILKISSCNNLKTLTGGFRSLTSLMILVASSCKSLDEEAVDILVETRSLLFLSIDESPSLIQRWKQIGHCYPLIVKGPGDVDDDMFLHTVEHTLFHGGSRFVGVDGDGGQLVDWSWSCFSGEEEEEEVEVEVSMLLTMCDLSLDCNNSALQIVRKEIERRMEESRNGGQKFQIVYAEAGDSVDSQSEEHIHQNLMKLIPNCTCACMPVDNRTNRLFAYALYTLLQSESRYVIHSLHTCIFGLRVRMQRDKKWAEFQSECFPNDYEEELRDQGGGFNKLFSTLDIYKF
ncbi:hypothetical protein SUGI_0479210 [Cryptomeria japonica]|nr:hypothetical protein SUGI_0479210 [Cryptomeria japonica]